MPATRESRPGASTTSSGSAPGGEVNHFASASWPHEVRVEPPSSARWIEVERRRLAGRLARVTASAWAQDFGGNAGTTDWLTRGEVDWTYRLVGSLYSFQLGYGFVEGVTPGPEDDQATTQHLPMTEVAHSGRWGYGGVRLRLDRSVWFDTRVILGLHQEGFMAGIGGELILGQDWRTCVKIGGEYFDGLLGSTWLRLQWERCRPCSCRPPSRSPTCSARRSTPARA